jgi:hypothetical protein
MRAGDAFYLPDRSADGHLWVVISDPEKNPSRVLFVSMTSYDVDKEAGEHPRVRHKTCINYKLTRHSTLEILDRLADTGYLQMQPPVSEEILQRIRRGLSLSRRIDFEYVELMCEQNLLD